MDYPEQLKDLQKLVAKHYDGVLRSNIATSTGRLPFVQISTSVIIEKPKPYLSYLPLFHVIGLVNNDGLLIMKLITFNGKELFKKVCI